MEALWTIHRDIPDAEFDDFIAAHTPLRPASARRMVLAWDVARKNRALRDLTISRPSETLNLVRGFIDAGGDTEEIQQFSEDDRAVVEVLSLPPRRRNEVLRGWCRRDVWQRRAGTRMTWRANNQRRGFLLYRRREER